MTRALSKLAVIALFSWVAVSRNLSAQSEIARARQLITVDSAAAAVSLLSLAIASGHDSSAYHLWLAAAYTADGARANFLKKLLYTLRIKKELQQAVHLDSNSVDARSELARFYLTAPSMLGGSFNRAEQLARSLSPSNPSRAHGLLGFIAHHRGDFKTAEREMRDAVAAQPDSAWSYTPLAFLLGEQQRNDEAFSLWEKSAALDSTYKASWMQMGIIGANTGTHLDAAAHALERYIAKPPRATDKRDRALANNRLGIIYEKLGRVKDARRVYREATELAPNSSTYKASLRKIDPAGAK